MNQIPNESTDFIIIHDPTWPDYQSLFFFFLTNPKIRTKKFGVQVWNMPFLVLGEPKRKIYL